MSARLMREAVGAASGVDGHRARAGVAAHVLSAFLRNQSHQRGQRLLAFACRKEMKVKRGA